MYIMWKVSQITWCGKQSTLSSMLLSRLVPTLTSACSSDHKSGALRCAQLFPAFQVSLPREDSALPYESRWPFQANQHLFSFSQAMLPSDEYADLRDDSNACQPTLELSADGAFYLKGTKYHLLGGGYCR